MPKKDSTVVNEVLFWIYTAADIASVFLASKHEWKKRMWGRTWGSYSSYKGTIYQLKRRGAVEFVEKDGRRYLKLTPKGELEVLLAKASVKILKVWDGKWRVLIFDIPEEAKLQRDQFRGLLKKNNFKKLQQSVYVSPYPFNREAIIYLKDTGLDKFIRVLKVEEMDNDADLKKKFNLK